MTGKCYSTTDCKSIGGEATTNCAVGFGVCCIVSVKASSATITKNCTYFANEDYPTAIALTATTNEYTFTPENPQDICAVRLDFNDLVLSVTASGVVNEALMTTTGQVSKSPPAITGTNTGMHMYIETGQQTTSAKVSIATIATTATAKWRIKACFIECTSTNLPDNGCTQWFTENTDVISSYGRGYYVAGTTGVENANQEMAICIRKNAGMCTITYQDNLPSADSFIVGAATANAETNGCIASMSAVLITRTPMYSPGAATLLGQVCHKVFAPLDAALTVATGIITQRPPFVIVHRALVPVAGTVGFNLRYNQHSCTASSVF